MAKEREGGERAYSGSNPLFGQMLVPGGASLVRAAASVPEVDKVRKGGLLRKRIQGRGPRGQDSQRGASSQHGSLTQVTTPAAQRGRRL